MIARQDCKHLVLVSLLGSWLILRQWSTSVQVCLLRTPRALEDLSARDAMNGLALPWTSHLSAAR